MITKNIKYSEILKRNNELAKFILTEKYEIKILSNIITSQLNEILEYTLRIDAIPAMVELLLDGDEVVKMEEWLVTSEVTVDVNELAVTRGSRHAPP